MPEDEVKIYLSAHCGPCQQVRAMIDEGRYNLSKPPVIIDVTSKEGFHFIADLGLVKVPTAMKGNQTCDILSDGESLMITCPGDNNPPAKELLEE